MPLLLGMNTICTDSPAAEVVGRVVDDEVDSRRSQPAMARNAANITHRTVANLDMMVPSHVYFRRPCTRAARLDAITAKISSAPFAVAWYSPSTLASPIALWSTP